MLLVGRQEGHPACKTREWWGAGVVICLEQGADLHAAQLVPLPLTVCCFTKIPIGFTFLVPVHVGSPGKRASYVCAKLSGIRLLLTEVLCGEVLLLCTVSVCLSVCLCVRCGAVDCISGQLRLC